MKQNNIEHHLVEIGDKQGVAYAERVNGTLRGLIEKYKSSHNRYNLVSIIPKLVENYNNTLHSITKSTPIDALKNTQEYHQRRNDIIRERLYQANSLNKNNQELKICDNVRLKIIRSVFEKGSIAKYTKTIHKIIGINSDGSFTVSDRHRRYKRNELQKVDVHNIQENYDKDDYETAERVAKQHKSVRRVKRRLNKEGLDEKNIIKDVNERTLRHYRHSRGINLNDYL